ncbi:MAG: diguanylate cyclase [Pseudomonadota bacterium]
MQRCKTLIVDDDRAVLSVLENLLSTDGMEVVTANSAEQALQLFTEQSFDVIVTDVQMGEMSGFDLLKRIKLVDAAMNVIVMTSFNSYESVLQALQLGAYDYIQKPLTNHPAVTAAVQRAFESTKLQQENFDLMVQLKASHSQLTTANRNLKQANRKLKRLAVTDGLTNLYNRRFFEQVLKREVGRRNRYKQALSVVMIDIDNFKAFNDKFGHSGGDQAIKAVASTLQVSARTTDIIARYGGEEFVVAVPLTDPQRAMIFAERLRNNAEKHIIEVSQVEQSSITLSIGVAGVYGSDGAISTAELLRYADTALYRSKEQGKNQCQIIEIGQHKPRAA